MSDETVQKTGGVVVHGVVPLSCFLIELCLSYPPPGCKTGCKIRVSSTLTRRYLLPLQLHFNYDYAQHLRKEKRSIIDPKTAIIIHSGKTLIKQSDLDRVFLFPGRARCPGLPASQPYTPGSSGRWRRDRPEPHRLASAIDTLPRCNGSAIKQPG
jgi:hypothetical protein